MIERHEIPLFEYDATSPEVIPPAHEFGDCRFPKKCLFAFLGDTIHRYAETKHAEKRREFRTVSATYPIYVFEEDGEEICLAQAPIGAPPASSMLDALIASGCRSILALAPAAYWKSSRRMLFWCRPARFATRAAPTIICPLPAISNLTARSLRP